MASLDDQSSRDDVYKEFYAGMSMEELRGVCDQQGKSKGGSKEDIINRLLDRSDASKKPEPSASPRKSRSQSPPKRPSSTRKSLLSQACACCQFSYYHGEQKSIWAAFGILVAFFLARLTLMSKATWVVAYADVGQAVLILISFYSLSMSGRDPLLVRLFIMGTLLGAAFEFWFDYMGESYHILLNPELKQWDKKYWVRGIAHSIGDGALFCIGVWLCRDFCPKPHFTHFNMHELGVMLVWGAGQAIVVELCYNGWVWSYPEGHKFNPVMFRLGGVAYTLAPQLLWLVFPIIFYVLTLEIWKFETA